MRVIPVLDVMNGVVVHAVGGQRNEYRPIVTDLTPSTNPVDVALAIIQEFRPQEMYLADLDAIERKPPAIETYGAILALGVRLWVDAGVRDLLAARKLSEAGCNVVAGLETVASADVLKDIVQAVGADRVVFSLDLKNGVPLRDWPENGQDRRHVPLVIASMAIDMGIKRLIVLDLAQVGGGKGTGTELLCREIASIYPHVEVIAGGGVAGLEDVRRLEACGVKGVLVASALHDGRIKSRYAAPTLQRVSS